jgi:hypothetical protein
MDPRSASRGGGATVVVLEGMALLFAACRATPPAAVPTADEPAHSVAGVPIHGSVRARYRYRTTSDEDDHDLYDTVTVDVGDPARQPFTAHLLAWSNLDLDERSEGDDPDPFFDLSDTYGSDLTARLYHAWVDKPGVDGLEVLRVGRQPLYETPEIVTFDGARVETAERGERDVRAGLYGGLPVHFFESSPSGDLVLGTFLEGRPWGGARARLDWMHLEDEEVLADHENDLLAAGLWQALGRPLRLEGAFSWLEGRARDARIAGTWSDAERSLRVRASLYELFSTQRDLASEVDNFYQALLEYFPFYRAEVLVSKDLGEHWRVELGSEVRQLEDESDEGEFNREYTRHHARLAAEDVVGEGVTLGLAGEVWDDGDGAYRTWGADLEKRWNERWRTSLGSNYALYKIDLFDLSERDDVRSWTLGVRYDATKATAFDLDYGYEDDDLDEYHVVRVGVQWRF